MILNDFGDLIFASVKILCQLKNKAFSAG